MVYLIPSATIAAMAADRLLPRARPPERRRLRRLSPPATRRPRSRCPRRPPSGPRLPRRRRSRRSPRRALEILKRVLQNPVIRVLIAAEFCTGIVRQGLLLYFPEFLEEVHGIAPGSSGLQRRQHRHHRRRHRRRPALRMDERSLLPVAPRARSLLLLRRAGLRARHRRHRQPGARPLQHRLRLRVDLRRARHALRHRVDGLRRQEARRPRRRGCSTACSTSAAVSPGSVSAPCSIAGTGPSGPGSSSRLRALALH